MENGLKNDPIVEEDESAEDDLSTSSEGGDETATQSTNVLFVEYIFSSHICSYTYISLF